MALGKSGEARKPVGADLVIPVAAVAFTIYYFASIWNAPWEAQVAAFLIGSILLGLVAIFLLRTARELVSGEADLSFRPLYEPGYIVPRRLALLVLTFGYLIGIEYLGFTLVSFLFLFLGMTVLSEARGDMREIMKYLTVSAILSLGGWLLFIVAFDARFPAGPFETLMERLLSL